MDRIDRRQTEVIALSQWQSGYPKYVCPTSACPNREGGGRERGEDGDLKPLYISNKKGKVLSSALEIGGGDQPTECIRPVLVNPRGRSGKSDIRFGKGRVMVRGKGRVSFQPRIERVSKVET